MLSIGRFSKIANVSTKTLRYYDEIGLLNPIYVDDLTGYRYYEAKQLEKLLLINKLKKYQFSLKEIAQIIDSSKDNTLIIDAIKNKLVEIERQVNYYNNIIKQLKSDILNLESGSTIMSYLEEYKVELVTSAKLIVYSKRARININNFSKLLQETYKELISNGLEVAGPPLAIYHDNEFNPEDYDVELAIIVKEENDYTKIIPSMLCAKAVLKGEYYNLSSVYAKLVKWIDDNNYTIVSLPFDIYLTDPSKVNSKDNITEVYFPVSKK